MIDGLPSGQLGYMEQAAIELDLWRTHMYLAVTEMDRTLDCLVGRPGLAVLTGDSTTRPREVRNVLLVGRTSEIDRRMIHMMH